MSSPQGYLFFAVVFSEFAWSYIGNLFEEDGSIRADSRQINFKLIKEAS